MLVSFSPLKLVQHVATVWPFSYLQTFGYNIWSIKALVAILAVFFVAVLAYRVIFALFISPLRNIPGPFIARLTAKRIEFHTMVGNMSKLGHHEFEKYGDISVLHPNAVGISNPADIKTLLGNGNVAKAPYYKILRFTGIDNTVSTQDMDVAQIRHRQIAPYFKQVYLTKMEKTIMECGIGTIKQKWDHLLGISSDGVAEVNYCNDMLFASFNIIGTLVYGRQIDELSKNDTATAQWIDTTVTYLGIRSMLQLLPQFPFAYFLKPWESRYEILSGYIHDSITSRREQLKKAEHNKPADLLQAFMDAEDPESNIRMNHEQIHAECMLMMLAGSDTTAHTLTWTLHLMLLYPNHFKRAIAEVRSQFPQDYTIRYSDCKEKLPFVEACIYESLRLVPVTGGLLPRVSPKGGTSIQGHYLPEDTLVFVNMAVANHHSGYWDRPYTFDPLRFLNNSEAKHNLLTFSHGRRTCPGRQLGWWEMLTILANIFKDYDLRLPPDFKHLGPDVLDKNGNPKLMDARQFIVVKPADPIRDCRILISRAPATETS